MNFQDFLKPVIFMYRYFIEGKERSKSTYKRCKYKYSLAVKSLQISIRLICVTFF